MSIGATTASVRHIESGAEALWRGQDWPQNGPMIAREGPFRA
jgi:hypothetical protein